MGNITINGKDYTLEQLAGIVSEHNDYHESITNPEIRGRIIEQLQSMGTNRQQAPDPYGDLDITNMSPETIQVVEASRAMLRELTMQNQALQQQVQQLAPTIQNVQAQSVMAEAIATVARATGKQLTPEQVTSTMVANGIKDPESAAWRAVATLPVTQTPPVSPSGATPHVFKAYDDTPAHEVSLAVMQGIPVEQVAGKTPTPESAIPPAGGSTEPAATGDGTTPAA